MVDAQFKLWELCPNSKYVANPNKGFSSHSRGNTVDITLIKADGGEVQMPTGFDDFSLKADRDYTDCPEEEEIDEISPHEGEPGWGSFKMNLAALRQSLDFFKGFYEGSQWRPITFENNGGEVNLRYKSATSNIFKSLETDEASTTQCSFDLLCFFDRSDTVAI